MGNDFSTNEIIVIIIVGFILVFLFYFLVYSIRLPSFGKRAKKQKSGPEEGRAGDPQTCPVCSAKLNEGQLVSSAAFPAAKGSNDRLMHIRGCTYCLLGDRERTCPVCLISITTEEHLVSRLFDRSPELSMGRFTKHYNERSTQRSHVHIVGCSKCKGPRSGRPS